MSHHEPLLAGSSAGDDDRKRAAFLGAASRALLSSLDYLATLQRLADLAIPTLADWCTLDMVKDDGEFARLAVAHSDPAKVQIAVELWNRYPPHRDDPAGMPHVVRTGEPEMSARVPDELLVAAARDADHLQMLRSLGLCSYIVVPLVAKGKVLGALTLVNAESGREHTESDLHFAEEFARLAAVAVDNARLFEAQAAARARAEESELAFRTFIDNLPGLAWTALPDGHIDFYNQRWFQYTGTTLEDMAGWGWQSVHDPAMLPAVMERWQRSLATGEPFEMEFPIRSADGELRWFLTRVSGLRDSGGRLVRWFGTNTDIHDLRAAKALADEMATQSDVTSELILELRRARDAAERRVAELEAENARLRQG